VDKNALIQEMAKLANSTADPYLQTRTFFILKIDYVANKCLDFYSSTINTIEEKAKAEAMKKIFEHRDKFKFSGAVQHKVSTTIKVATVSEFSFYLDTFIESCDRLVRHEIKNSIFKLSGDKLKSVTELMNIFKDGKLKLNNINARYIKDNPELRKYYISEWDNWIKELNTDRANSVHNFRVKQFDITIETFYNSLTKSVSEPANITSEELKLNGIFVNNWINQTRKRTFEFVKENGVYLKKKGLQ